MLFRRQFVASCLGLAALPRAANARSTGCIETQSRNGWSHFSKLDTDGKANSADGDQYRVSSKFGEMGISRISAEKFPIDLVVLDKNLAHHMILNTRLIGLPDGNKYHASWITLPGAVLDPIVATYGISVVVDGETLVEQVPVSEGYNSVDKSYGFALGENAHTKILNGNSLLAVLTGNGQELARLTVDLKGATSAWSAAESWHAKRRSDFQTCELSCAMTDAAVDLLGRHDNCFELRQMRKLRASFPELKELVQLYHQFSFDVSQLRNETLRRMILLMFYGLVAWPSAILAYCGWMRLSAFIYAAGFFFADVGFAFARVLRRITYVSPRF